MVVDDLKFCPKKVSFERQTNVQEITFALDFRFFLWDVTLPCNTVLKYLSKIGGLLGIIAKLLSVELRQVCKFAMWKL